MTISEQDLRELLRERSDVVPSSPDRVDAVKQRVRRQRRFEAAAVGAGLVAALVAVAAVVVPRVGDTSPTPVPPATQTATPGPQVTGSATYDGIRMDTSGPATVHGTTPFAVTVTVTNTTPQEWRGSVVVGVHRPGPRPNEADSLFTESPATADGHDTIVMLADGLTELDGVRSDDLVLAAGSSTVVTFALERSPGTTARPDIRGWIPWVQDAAISTFDPTGFSLVVVDPSTTVATCASFTVTNATETRLPQQLLGAATTTTTSASAPASWTEVPGLPGSFAPSVAGVDVDVVTLVNAVGALGATFTMAGGASRDPDLLETTQNAGSWVTYSGISPNDIAFSGQCGLVDGTVLPGTMTGVLHTYRVDEGGWVDCALVPPPKSLGLAAAAYCPAGSKARKAFQAG
jgi:hypothetical protein